MQLDDLRTELRKLIGVPVSFTRIAGSGIILYFYGEPGDGTVVSVWLEPPWRYERNPKVILGSSDLQLDKEDFASEEAYETEWSKRCSLVNDLSDAFLEEIEIDEISSDLTMQFSSNQILRNFSNTALRDTSWTYRNTPTKLRAEVSSMGVEDYTID